MAIELKISFENISDLAYFVNKAASQQYFSSDKEANKKPVAMMKTDKPAPEAPKPEATFDDVKNSILKVSREKGRDAAVKVLAKFNYEKVSADMKKEDYEKVVNECEVVLKAA